MSPAPSAARTKRLHLRPRDLQAFNKRGVREIFAERSRRASTVISIRHDDSTAAPAPATPMTGQKQNRTCYI